MRGAKPKAWALDWTLNPQAPNLKPVLAFICGCCWTALKKKACSVAQPRLFCFVLALPTSILTRSWIIKTTDCHLWVAPRSATYARQLCLTQFTHSRSLHPINPVYKIQSRLNPEVIRRLHTSARSDHVIPQSPCRNHFVQVWSARMLTKCSSKIHPKP